MSFEFSVSKGSMGVANASKEPPDKGAGQTMDSTFAAGGGNGLNAGVSFRDKVLGFQSIPKKEKTDLVAQKVVNMDLVNGSRLLPMFTIDQKYIDELSKPLKHALIVKQLGKPLGFNAMKAKLSSTWKLLGGFDLMDIGNGYFMVIFELDDDRNRVINGGPWMIYDHYLTVRTWSADFNANIATIDKTMVWIRIPSLNMVYYDESLIWAFASAIGNPIKVDLHTLRMARGRFARVCVEVDLNQPSVGRVGVQGSWYNVEYEGLHIICAQCGCYGHLLKDCPAKKHVEKAADGGSGDQNQKSDDSEKSANTVNGGADIAGSSDMDQVKEITHGEWLNVVRRKRNNKKSNEPKLKETKSHDWGNKFNALNIDINYEYMINDDMHGRPAAKEASANKGTSWSNKKRQRREQWSNASSSQAQNKGQNGNMGATQAGALRGDPSERRLRNIVTNGDHLKLKAKFEEAMHKLINNSSGSKVEESISAKPLEISSTGRLGITQPEFPPEPGEQCAREGTPVEVKDTGHGMDCDVHGMEFEGQSEPSRMNEVNHAAMQT